MRCLPSYIIIEGYSYLEIMPLCKRNITQVNLYIHIYYIKINLGLVQLVQGGKCANTFKSQLPCKLTLQLAWARSTSTAPLEVEVTRHATSRILHHITHLPTNETASSTYKIKIYSMLYSLIKRHSISHDNFDGCPCIVYTYTNTNNTL